MWLRSEEEISDGGGSQRVFNVEERYVCFELVGICTMCETSCYELGPLLESGALDALNCATVHDAVSAG